MSGKKFVPDWKLQRYLLGELPADDLGAIRAQEQSDGELRGRLDALRADRAEIRERYPPEWMARKALLLFESRRRSARRPDEARAARGFPYMRAAVPVFACAALMAAIPIYMASTGKPADGQGAGFGSDGMPAYGIRAKGGAAEMPELQVWRKAEDRPEMLEPNAAVRSGDIVQLWYIVPAPCYGTLVSVDGRGVLTEHLTGSGGKAAPLTPGRPVSLTSSYQLDDAPKYEAFYLITSAEEFDLEPVKKTLLDVKHPVVNPQSLPLPEKRIAVFTLRKIDMGREI